MGIEVVHVNEVKGGVDAAAHLFEFDTVHGRYEGSVTTDGGAMIVDQNRIGFSEHAKPADIPWGDLGVDIVIESSGKFKTSSDIEPHLVNGAEKVVVACPMKSEGVLNIVMGCNDHLYDPAIHRIVTAASCTTNCLAPVVKVLHEKIGIERGAITTVHDVTNTQVIVDAPHKDLRRARSALNSLVPTSTGSATAITMIYPELKGKLNGVAVRVPLLNASLTDCVFTMNRDVTIDEVNGLLEAASNGELSGILGYESRPLVSADFVNDPRSGIVDGPSTMVIDGRMVKVLVWYDNEFGYAYRMAELVIKVGMTL
jgi:glyceraldehyde 3-phosphate dehydrogenase